MKIRAISSNFVLILIILLSLIDLPRSPAPLQAQSPTTETTLTESISPTTTLSSTATTSATVAISATAGLTATTVLTATAAPSATEVIPQPAANLAPADAAQPEVTNPIYLPIIVNEGRATITENAPTPPSETMIPHHDLGAAHTHGDAYWAELAKSYPPFVAPEVEPAAATDLIQVGQWGPVIQWPHIPVTAASLPDGRILTFASNEVNLFPTGTEYTHAAVWDPATGQFLQTPNTYHDMFCGIPVTLEDGRVLINGGNANPPTTSIFDYRTNQWQRIEDMQFGRWYPNTVALPGKQVFTAIGRGGAQYPEVWTEGQGWRLLTGADLTGPILSHTSFYEFDWLPYFHLAPNGQIFHSGPTPQMHYINPTGNGGVSAVGLSNTWYPKYAVGVMYDEGKVLIAGGQVNGSNLASVNQAYTVDLNGPTPVKTTVAPMTFARKFHNSVVLPTGEVMVVGGNTSGIEFSDQGSILTPEIWNPDTQSWRTVAPMSVPRNYHSVALLLTDGRVWSAGGGLCACAADHMDAQIYSPPYLFNPDGSLATRPTITSAPHLVNPGTTFTVQASPDVQRFSLIKLSALTHNMNSDLRYLRVPFTTLSAGNYQLTLHSNVNVLTPGYWMLFAVDSQGVPSVAKVMQIIGSSAPQVDNPGPQSNLVNDVVNLTITAVDPNGDPLTFSANGLPEGLAINASTGVIAGTTTTGGFYQTTVTVSDGVNNTSVNFNWAVTQPGTTRFVKLEALSEVAGNPWTSTSEFNLFDSNGNPIDRSAWTVSADSEETQGENGRAINAIDGNPSSIWHTQWWAANPPHPHWLVIDLGAAHTIGGFRYLPSQHEHYGRIANYRFYLSADGVNWGAPLAQGTFPNTTAEQTVNITPNRPPTLNSPGDQTTGVGDPVNLTVVASDPDGDALTFSASGLPEGLSISTNGVIAGNVTTAGVSSVTVTVQDGRGGVATASFTWTVTPPALSLNPIISPPQPVNTPLQYTASANNGVNPRFKWLFGDNTPETAYSATPTVEHTFTQPGIYVVTLTAIDDRGVEQSLTFVQAIHLPLTASRPAVSMNILYEPAGGRVWTVNQDNDTVSVFNASTNAKVAEIAVGAAPRSLALAPDGRIWVVNKGAATISILSPSTLAVVQTVTLPYASQPFGLAFAPNGSAAYVTLEGAGKLLRLDPATGAQTGSLDIGPNGRHLSISADSSKLYVSRFITPRLPGEETAAPQTSGNVGGEVLVVDSASFSLSSTIILKHDDRPDSDTSGRGIPNYLGPAVISPDGLTAWVPSKQDNLLRGSLRDGRNLTFESTVRSVTSRIDLINGVEDHLARIDHDNAGIASTGVFNHSGNYLFVALEGTREVAVIDAYARSELFKFDVGRAPQGLALSADGLRLYVHNFMDRTISVHDLTALVNQGMRSVTTLATLSSVGTERLTAQVLAGKQFFYDSKDPRLARDGYMSCASCHNDGGQDGRVWDLTGMGEGLRNTVSLQGRAGLGQGFLHWSGNFDEVQDFEGQIRNLAGGTGLMTDAVFQSDTRSQPLGEPKAGLSADLDALAAYVASLSTFPGSPYRNNDATLTADGLAGKTIFQNANCAECHSGAAFTESGAATLRDIGTLKPTSGSRLGAVLTGLDTPTLRGVWATAPYLHDGSAATLADAVRAHNGLALTDPDLATLVAYLQQIDANESTAPAPNQPPVLTNPGNQTGAVGVSVNLTISATDPDGNALTYSATGLPAGLTLNPSTGVISGAPTTTGSNNVTLTVSDGLGGTASQSFIWTINAPVTIAETFANFSNVSKLQLNGNAARSNNRLRLTPNTTNRRGTALYKTVIPISDRTSFSTQLQFRISSSVNGGADGITFMVQGNSTTSLGTGGSGLGYQGIGKSLAVELDTYAGSGDPNANHVAILTNGNVTTHLASYTPGSSLKNGQTQTLWIDYDGTTNTLTVYLVQSATTTKPSTPILTRTNVDLFALVGAQGYLGFSAATGGAANRHDILNWSFTVTQ